MFCFQCEQTAQGKGCTINGVCGKKGDTAGLQDRLTGAIIDLSEISAGKGSDKEYGAFIQESLFVTVTNVNFDNEAIEKYINKALGYLKKAGKETTGVFDVANIWNANEDIRSLKTLILLGMRGMAAYAHHAYILGYYDPSITEFMFKGLAAIKKELGIEELLKLVLETGEVNLRCMELLDKANTETYGTPVPTVVSKNIEKGPFIIITGHDLHDLKELLIQTEGKGINIYTHGEMLPAHGYPELKKYPHLKGNFGTAWQNQQKEFDNVPAPILYTTNCLMLPKTSYSEKIFTTSMVGFPNTKHIPADANGHKDFSELIAMALKLGGYKEETKMTGINGGDTLMTGFARGTVMGAAGTVIDAVKSKALRHIFLVGGCDGAKPGRNYYTDFVAKAPKDTLILTLACGKYRFNDMSIGEIGGLPRILDMGQCNDAYSAIVVASALAEAFGCTVNDLPLTLVLSWYEQKAVCILLTLLHLGLRNIYLGPSLPAFVSPGILDVLVKNFGLKPISTPEEDLKSILHLETV